MWKTTDGYTDIDSSDDDDDDDDEEKLESNQEKSARMESNGRYGTNGWKQPMPLSRIILSTHTRTHLHTYTHTATLTPSNLYTCIHTHIQLSKKKIKTNKI